MTEAVGWAVVASGARIFVKTVSETRRAAIINYLVVEHGQLITIYHSDQQIEALWKRFGQWMHFGQYVECKQVKITDVLNG
jgi:hypothetical protein